jgi:hypothetical protein
VWVTVAFLQAASLTAPQTSPPSKPTAAKPAPPAAATKAPDFIILKETTTLPEVLKAIQARTGTPIQIEESARSYAATYVFPPTLAGTKLDVTSATPALNFITGTGWEGSKLAADKREAAGPNYMLAHTPFVSLKAPRYWTCNNRAWDWGKETIAPPPSPSPSPSPSSSPTTAGPAPAPKPQSVVKFKKRVSDDGDIVASQPINLGKLKDDDTLRTVLQLVRLKANVTVNIVGSEFAPGAAAPGAAPRLLPMTVGAIPPSLRGYLEKPVTVGVLLTVLAEGLNRYTAKNRGHWKWSATFSPPDASGLRKVIYTLRDYANR